MLYLDFHLGPLVVHVKQKKVKFSHSWEIVKKTKNKDYINSSVVP